MKNILKKIVKKNEKYKKTLPINPRYDDIYLVSYPKSGNTWLLFLISNVIIEYLKLDININFFNLHTFIPDIHVSRDIPVELQFYPFRRIIKSHAEFNPFYNNIFLLLRNPYDVMLSFFYYLKNSGRYQNSFEQFVKKSNFGIHSWVRHTEGWINKEYLSKKLKILSFESLRNAPFNELSSIFNLMGYKIEKRIFEKAISKSSFDNMKKIENKTNSFYVKQFTKFNFVRKGEINQKDELLNDDIINYIQASIKNIEKILRKQFMVKL